SLGAFAGITIKIPTKPKEAKIAETYTLAVTARDKFTKQVLPNTDIAVKNLKGEIIATGTTNNYGVLVFKGIKPDNYTIDGLLHEVALDPSSASKSEFIKSQTLQKEVIYSNEEFILEGNAVVCNTTEGIRGVKVKLQNKSEGIQKSTMTDNSGKYIFHVKQNKTYTLSGKKDKYFSQVETINTSDFNRNTTLFVKLEICMEKVDCGDALNLNDIQYDLDKFNLRNDAKAELDRLVLFMKDYPALTVKLSSHTDSRGSDSYNMTLSQQRADAAVDYMVSQGISRSKISGKGYGETKLLNRCSNGSKCSEAEHQINRRTEMKVICPN
ncbi:MAG: OmpA family protein, partial [Flavobacteriales bacterium]